jgi:RNA polymerase sigma-70 factor (ECF subfamily)
MRQSRDSDRAADDTVVRAQAGDPSAFDALYESNVPRVYAICLRMTADRELAEELTQDVFVRAWRRIRTFRGASAFSSWIHRVAVNLVLDHRRRHRNRRPESTGLDAVQSVIADTESDPIERMALEAAVASLPERARMALVLHAVEGYKYEDIAEMMDVSVGTVKSHIHRARALLLERLEPQ